MPMYYAVARYSDEAIKGMVANPTNREEAGRAFVEAIGGKLHAFYHIVGGHNDVMYIVETPDHLTGFAADMVLRASGAMADGEIYELMSSDDGVESMKKAGAIAAGYKPPTG